MVTKKFYQKKTNPKIQRKKRVGIVYILFFCLILAVLVAIPFALLKFSLFNIKQVEVLLEQVKCTSKIQVLELIKIDGQNILFLDASRVKEKISKAFICTKGISIQKKYPNSVLINIVGRQPKLNILAFESQEASFSAILNNLVEQTSSTSASTSSAKIDLNKITGQESLKSLLVDEEGVIFATPEQEEVQKLYFEDVSLTVGKNIQKDKIKNILEVFSKLQVLNTHPEETVVFANDIMYIKSESIILIDLKQDISSQLASLQLILEKAKIENEGLKLIDLRFNKPVIRYGEVKK